MAKKLVSRRVISLEGSPRTERFFAQPAAAGFELFSAVVGTKALANGEYDTAAFEKRYKRVPKPGEAGCTLSHMELIRGFAEADGAPADWLLVAEDDVVFHPDFEEVLENVCEKAARFDIVHLASPFEGFSKIADALQPYRTQISLFSSWVGPKPFPAKFRIGPYSDLLYGTGLYLISRAGCQHYCDFAAKFPKPFWQADDYSLFEGQSELSIGVLRPNLCSWSGGSEISEDQVHLFWARRLQSIESSRIGALRILFGRKAWGRWRKDLRRTLSATANHLRSWNK